MNIKELFSTFKAEDFYSNINLHIHSNYSDGILDFDKLIEEAKTLNMKYISITDHNTILGYKNSKYKNDEILITGVEFDCFYKMSLLHILGYGIDIENEELNKICAESHNKFKRVMEMRHPKVVIDAIHNAGGIAIIAHPCCNSVFNLDNYTKHLIDLGLDGIETYYPYKRYRAYIKFSSEKEPFKIAQKYNLIKTGGTDEHKNLLKNIKKC